MEKSVFEYSSQRIFSISGNITDSFCTPDLQILSFEKYLCGYLRKTGYECIVFYSGGGTGLYFCDRKSAENYAECIEKKPVSEKAPEPEADDIFNVFGIQKKSSGTEKKKTDSGKKIRMRYPMENDADFIHKAEALMKNRKHRTAVVFTSFDDFVNRTDSVSRRNYNRLFESWKSMTSDNRNICIFLSKGLGTKEIQQMLSNNSELSLSSLFLSEDNEGKRKFNSDTCVVVKHPGSDELRNLLCYWAVRGCTSGSRIKKLKFSWDEKSIDETVNAMLFYCHESENGLNTFRDRIEIYMRDYPGDEVPFSAETVNKIYEQKNQKYSSEDPEKLLESRRNSGWANACDVIKRNIDEFETFVKYSTPEEKEQVSDLYSLERFENLDCKNINYRIPNFVIQGNPGVGKTEIARLIGRILHKHGMLSSGHTVCASRDTLVGQYVGASAINTVNAVERAQGGVLFIDEVYSLVNLGDSSSSGGENYCAEVINTLVAAMTNPKYHFCVVVAGYEQRMKDFFRMNEGLPSRFSMKNIITIDDYTPDILERIFREYMAGKKLTLSEDTDKNLGCYFVNLYRERDRKTFGNARDIITLAKSVAGNAQMRTHEAYPVIEKKDFSGSEHLFEGFGASTRDEAYAELKKYIGMDFLEQMFDDQCNLYDECTDKGIPYPGPEHMIWVGNPGTGKSTAAKLLSQLYYATGLLGGRSPVIVDASSLIGTHVGDSQKLINEKMDEAAQNNAVLVIEEAYQLSKDKNYGHAALNSMMNRMVDERKKFNVVFIVYSSEYEDFISSNAGILSRCTRYDFRDYNPEQLTEIFLKMCRDSKDICTDEALIKVREYMEELYRTRNEKTGNARAVERFLADMRKKRYPRIRSMKNVPPEEKYRFEPEDVPVFEKGNNL